MRYGILFITVIAIGCATSYSPPTKYVLESDVQVAAAQQPLDKTLGIRPLVAARPYKQKVVYRESGFVLGEYSTVEWAELPADVVTRILTDAIVATHHFKDVGNAEDLALPDLILTGELRKFDVVRTADPWEAECEVHLELRDTQQPQAVWADTLKKSEPLERNEPAALPSAMSRAVAKIVKQAAEAIVAR